MSRALSSSDGVPPIGDRKSSCQGHEPVGGEPAGDVLDVRVEAAVLMHHQHRWQLAGGTRRPHQIAPQRRGALANRDGLRRHARIVGRDQRRGCRVGAKHDECGRRGRGAAGEFGKAAHEDPPVEATMGELVVEIDDFLLHGHPPGPVDPTPSLDYRGWAVRTAPGLAGSHSRDAPAALELGPSGTICPDADSITEPIARGSGGAQEVNPDVKFTVSFIGSWYDPPKAKAAALAMIDQGSDMLYAERFGVSNAAKERGVKAIGNVIDTEEQHPDTVVASALWHMEPSLCPTP